MILKVICLLAFSHACFAGLMIYPQLKLEEIQKNPYGGFSSRILQSRDKKFVVLLVDRGSGVWIHDLFVYQKKKEDSYVLIGCIFSNPKKNYWIDDKNDTFFLKDDENSILMKLE